MRRWVLLLAVIPILSVGSAQDKIPKKRVPGEIRIEGSPEPFGTYGLEVAFPRLSFKRPLFLTYPPDGTDRIFVCEQDGRVHVFDNKRDVPGTEVALDIRSKVYRRHNEEGLLGMAFHPEFRKNRYVFLHYSANSPRRGVVSRFKMDSAGKKIDPRSEKVILEQAQPWGNHNGGSIEFGPDGYLYIAFGDGGSANDPKGSGQDLRTWLGAILRIDVNRGSGYGVPRDNPFVGRGNARGEIWAYGLRNVWRMSFDRATGDLWAGDIGQNRWEEIDIIVKGGNYGWNVREGKHQFRGSGKGPFIEPVIDHNRQEAKSITGGYVYRGARLPGLVGAYLYADYATSNVWMLRWNGERVEDHSLIGRQREVSSFGEDRDGEVYLTSFDGKIYKVIQQGGGSQKAFPTRLSQTGLFKDTAKLIPHESLIPYSVNMPLWSEGASKRRWIMLPGMEKLKVKEDGTFEFPTGTILVKHFFFEGKEERRLETRLLIRSADGWAGYTYVWGPSGQDAYLIADRVDRSIPVQIKRKKVERTWTFPSRGDCMGCHTAVGGDVLGFRVDQLDRGRQLEALGKLGLFDKELPKIEAFPDWSDKKADLGKSMRAYLAANCAMCHRPSGPANATIDLRYSTPLEETKMIGVDPGQGDLGVRGAKLLVPGKAKKSLIYLRMNRTDEKGMPNLSHNSVDTDAVKRLEKWIKSLK